MAEAVSPPVAWSDGGPSSSLASSSRAPLCSNEASVAGSSTNLKRAACPSEEVVSVKRTRSNDVRELSCQLEQLHMKECRLLKDMEEMLMSVQLKYVCSLLYYCLFVSKLQNWNFLCYSCLLLEPKTQT